MMKSPLVVSLLRTDKLLVVGIMLVRSCNGQSCMQKSWPLRMLILVKRAGVCSIVRFFVTIEPCVMCSGAIGLARIPKVIYGAKNQKFGAAGSLYDILTDERLNHRVEVETGILEDECAGIMQDFFRNRRKK